MVVNKERLIMTVLVFLVFVSFASAAGIPLILSKNSEFFTEGDNIIVKAQVNNVLNYPVSGKLLVSLVNENEDIPQAIIPYKFNLKRDENKQIIVYDDIIDKDLKDGRYSVNVDLVLDGQRISSKSIEFKLKDMDMEFNFALKTCGSEPCREEKNIFVIGDDVFLDYAADTTELEIQAYLTGPSENKEEVVLPHSFKAEKEGAYILDTIASKQGYRTVTKKEQFAVIEKKSVVITSQVCNANKICEDNENHQTCPQDCKTTAEETELPVKKKIPYSLYALALGILAILFLIYYFYKRKTQYRYS